MELARLGWCLHPPLFLPSESSVITRCPTHRGPRAHLRLPFTVSLKLTSHSSLAVRFSQLCSHLLKGCFVCYFFFMFIFSYLFFLYFPINIYLSPLFPPHPCNHHPIVLVFLVCFLNVVIIELKPKVFSLFILQHPPSGQTDRGLPAAPGGPRCGLR